ncbi:TetR/AcrR family transcriptional regulator [Umezawaea tangerina]|uniref:TetR family transcriptional regulator n=1 Tax=Umezawaea tangerina TaxID=84725 RepID=A0A2T0T6L3_9PSEU|nr:TetR/AcrR family transcriptional regulator [Umezawaea tangerina]PRY41327.1 TetR family transcriptional regulator [Umezawaea tangerina]
MSRWRPDGADRLQAAAFDLFDEQGFEGTTVAEIARRAGLTQRTFFNHFPDKREVLFNLSSAFEREVVDGIAGHRDGSPPLDVVVAALQLASDATFEGRRAAVTRRHNIIRANPDLLERELGKQAALTDAIATALRERGLAPDTAVLAAGAGMLVQQTAVRSWILADDGTPLRRHLSDALRALRTTVAPASPDPGLLHGGGGK